MLLPPTIAFLLPCSTQTKLIMLVLCTAVVIIAVDFLNLILVPSIQMRTPTALTGKVMAIISSLTICAQPLGQMLYGWLHAHCTVWFILLISALASLPWHGWLAHCLCTLTIRFPSKAGGMKPIYECPYAENVAQHIAIRIEISFS